MGEGNTKPSICCGCHGWRIIALLVAGDSYFLRKYHFSHNSVSRKNKLSTDLYLNVFFKGIFYVPFQNEPSKFLSPSKGTLLIRCSYLHPIFFNKLLFLKDEYSKFGIFFHIVFSDLTVSGIG